MSFLAQLDFDDLRRLRQVVKRVHMSEYPKEFLTDHEADKVIEAFGEETMQNLLRAAVDNSVADSKSYSGLS
jgi:hypothetical protein|tara:strand:+ start:3719 stop:3934 length:216 start_codon:yes stop_codon:yes gene_type:complete